ncbi:MAG: rhodanese-related sulfurtransferase [Tunicatimonas sp.]
MPLHNHIDGKILKRQLQSSTEPRTTLSFYQYAHLTNPWFFRDYLYQQWNELGVLGRAYVAHEGINAQVSVPNGAFEAFKKVLHDITFLEKTRLNIAVEDNGKSFFKLKIQVKEKIVADGLTDAHFDVTRHGQHLNAEAFNALTDRPETVVVDMRNHYESEVGHFENAILPDVDTFRDSLPVVLDILKDHREQPIVMYCTGGIRCEKASAYLKHQGFEKVYQLEGGIIKYAHEVQEKGLKNKFRGKNFVFDERLGERVSDEIISHCHQCGKPCDTHTNCPNEACHLLFIQCAECAAAYDGCCSTDCQDFLRLPVEEQRLRRKNKKSPARNVFRKGRTDHLKAKKEK